MNRVSIGTWAYSVGPYANNPVPFGEVVKGLKAMGFDGLELGAFGAHPTPDNHPTKESRQTLRDFVLSNDLEFSGIAGDMWSEKLVNAEDGGQSYLATVRKNLEFAQDLGITLFRVDTVQPPEILDTVEKGLAMDRVVKTWRKVCRMAADMGMLVTWEFEPGFVFNRPSDIVALVDAVGEKNFGAMFDTCHAYTCGVDGAAPDGRPQGGVAGRRPRPRQAAARQDQRHPGHRLRRVAQRPPHEHPQPDGRRQHRLPAGDEGAGRALGLAPRLVDDRPLLLAQRLARHQEVQEGGGQAERPGLRQARREQGREVEAQGARRRARSPLRRRRPRRRRRAGAASGAKGEEPRHEEGQGPHHRPGLHGRHRPSPRHPRGEPAAAASRNRARSLLHRRPRCASGSRRPGLRYGFERTADRLEGGDRQGRRGGRHHPEPGPSRDGDRGAAGRQGRGLREAPRRVPGGGAGDGGRGQEGGHPHHGDVLLPGRPRGARGPAPRSRTASSSAPPATSRARRSSCRTGAARAARTTASTPPTAWAA